MTGSTDGICEMRIKLQSALLSYYNFDEFRPGQLKSLIPIVHGKDVFIRLATGSGKSLCMFLAPLAASNTAMAVIVSPLNGLMDEQVNSLYTPVVIINVKVGHWERCSCYSQYADIRCS